MAVPPTVISRPACKQQALQSRVHNHYGAKYQCYSASDGSGSRGSTPRARLATSTRRDPQLHRSTLPSSLGIRHLANLSGCQHPIRLDKIVHSVPHSQIAWLGGLYVQISDGMLNSQQLTLDRRLRHRMGISRGVLHIYLLHRRIWRWGPSMGCTIRSCHGVCKSIAIPLPNYFTTCSKRTD